MNNLSLVSRPEEQCVMVCPQCDGEGSYADGLDEAACSTDCTRCGGNGWIADIAALRAREDAGSPEVTRADKEAFVAMSRIQGGPPVDLGRVLMGQEDEHVGVQSYARHRSRWKIMRRPPMALNAARTPM